MIVTVPQINCDDHNPEEQADLTNSIKVDAEDYQLHQNYFTFREMRLQKGYQTIFAKKYVYMGAALNGLRHGLGVLITESTLYEGSFSLGHKMGKGYMKFSNQSIYIGDFSNNKPHGYGMLTFAGEYYIGDFQNGTMQGDGLWKNEKGQKYVGAWKDNKAHGYGVYTTDVSHYQGTRINNIGEFNQFVKHGYGIEKFTNGDSYRGYYEKGKPHGRGEYTWRNVAVYRGEFKQGLREGEGVWKGASGDEYHGHYSSDRKNGYGSFRWANGNCYKGQFNDDAREGSGEMVWSDGSVYQGEWMKGLPNGTGLFKVRGQRPRIGIFENNILISESRLNEDSIQAKFRHQQRGVSLGLRVIPELSKRSKQRLSRGRQRIVSKGNPSISTTIQFRNPIKLPSNRSYHS